MNSEEAKRILLAWRPESADEQDPEVARALALAEHDPVLQAWLAQHRAFQESMRRGFRAAPVPADLPGKILAAPRKPSSPTWWRRPAPWATAAALAFLLGVAALWMRPTSEDSFATFRLRMVGNVLRQYSMDKETSDLAAIRRHLAAGNAPADFSLPPRLAPLPVLGAGLLSWQDRKVSMVCLTSTNHGTLFLFVVDRSSLTHPPKSTPEFAHVSKLMTASWSEGKRTYLLAMKGRKEDVLKFFAQ